MDHMFFKEEERVPLPPLIYLRGHVTNGEGEKERGAYMAASRQDGSLVVRCDVVSVLQLP
jgi:hypothetical protein